MCSRNHQRGFTLMEVLVAMVVLSLSLMAVIKVVGAVTTSAMQLQNKTYAQWVALDKIAEMRLQTTWPPVGKTDGESKMAGRSWHWVTQVENTADKDVHKLIVSVNPEADKDKPVAVVEITAFLGRPL